MLAFYTWNSITQYDIAFFVSVGHGKYRLQLGELRCWAAQALSTCGPGAFKRLDGVVISSRVSHEESLSNSVSHGASGPDAGTL